MAHVLRVWNEEGRTLALRHEGETLELVLGNVVLLSSAALETERRFGQLAKNAVAAGGSSMRVLVGGLGFGATLRGVLDVLPEDGRVVVVEKLAAVLEIAKKEAAHLVAGALDDPRVEIEHADVADAIARERELSAILLDVDNGPEWAGFRTNTRLYADAALSQARSALRVGGLFAVWSGYPADAFLARLRKTGFKVHIAPLEERGVVRARAYVGTR